MLQVFNGTCDGVIHGKHRNNHFSKGIVLVLVAILTILITCEDHW